MDIEQPIQFDADDARLLFQEGAFFILLDMPEGSEFGIDMKVWNTADKFKGIKMIPPGLHFIHYSSVDVCGEVGPRSGFFHFFKKQEVYVKRWNRTEEGIVMDDVVSDQQINRLKDNLENLDRHLGPYPYEIYEKWLMFTEHITESLIDRITPTLGIIHSALDMVPNSEETSPRVVALRRAFKKISRVPTLSDHESSLPDMKPVDGTEIKFTKFPECHYPEGATPSEITKHSLDHSYILTEMLKNYEKPLDLLGEIEYCFICFLIGHSLESFERWQELIGLLCKCDEAITKHRQLFDQFIDKFELHINEIPKEFFYDIVSKDCYIYVQLKNLFRSMQSSKVDDRLKSKVARFKERVVSSYDWNFGKVESDDSDDDPPVVVDENECLF